METLITIPLIDLESSLSPNPSNRHAESSHAGTGDSKALSAKHIHIKCRQRVCIVGLIGSRVQGCR